LNQNTYTVRDALILPAEFLEKYNVKSKVFGKMGKIFGKIVAEGLELTVLCMEIH